MDELIQRVLLFFKHLLILRIFPGTGLAAKFCIDLLCFEFKSAVQTLFSVNHFARILAEECFGLTLQRDIMSMISCMQSV
jgi:hypothetical protein